MQVTRVPLVVRALQVGKLCHRALRLRCRCGTEGPRSRFSRWHCAPAPPPIYFYTKMFHNPSKATLLSDVIVTVVL